MDSESNTVELSKFDNSFYRPGSKFKIFLWYIFNRLFINTYLPFPVFIKTFVLRVFGAKIGKNFFIKPRVNIKYPWYLTVGDNVWIGENVWIDNLDTVLTGDNVCISQGAMILCGNHDYKKPKFDLILGSIVLEDGVWICANSIVCPGVICKSHSILSVGSIATNNLDPFYIYKGNPAKRIKKRVFIK